MLAALLIVAISAVPARADSIRDKQWYWSPMKVSEAQKITKGGGVVVAVLDTGVDAGHPDLRGAVLPGRQIVQNKPAGNDDSVGHGTGMAGIIAGRGHGSGDGILGIAPQAKILPIRPVNDTFFVAQGIRWAVDHGAKVITLAFQIDPSENLQSALKEAAAADVVLVGAAGNEADKGNDLEYPGAYPQVLTVGAVDRRNKVAAFSNHGPQVDLAAPGVDITVPAPGNTYAEVEGSSVSAALVAGAAALIRAEHPDLTAAQVVNRLTSTAIDRGTKGRDDYYGAGQLDLMAALTAPEPKAGSAAPATTEPPAAAPPTGPVSDDDEGIPPLVIVAAGVVLLAAATLAVFLLARRRAR
ncbi:type VII secretion-associated serine protease mycosin [Couchioplanes caeruleus]|uniref:type VII secretion-associated serine protease mycosin n=1 Tax=Couchioplanes caeruleus TaxID=56438 RepID=UPI00201BC221|nr:type VII secretion-associated serine protease mycosin [Couchioplanes caeruleus]UQU65717.1 type VII secretion-associated serine protease mycosin [Couchioplanes caeruleus]